MSQFYHNLVALAQLYTCTLTSYRSPCEFLCIF